MPADLLAHLTDLVGATHVLTGDAAAGHCTDWTGHHGGPALAVVRPADTAQVAAVLAACHGAGQAVVPQGGNTGLVGGGVPRDGEILLSLTRLDHIDVDPTAMTATTGAGATLAAVQAAAAPHGLTTGVDLAARDSATIGGMVATNAGGIRVVAHGTMRQQLHGIQAVTADGTTITRMDGLAKDNAGYDLAQVLAGSEGTLAVVTAAVLRLVPRPATTTVLLLACDEIADALTVTGQARRVAPLLAVEVMRADGMALVATHTDTTLPLPAATPYGLLVEWDGDVDPDRLAEVVGARPAVVAQDQADARALWAVRERHTEALAVAGVRVKLDLTVPARTTAAFLHDLDTDLPGAVVFGHLADGTLHVNLLDPPADAVARVLALVATHHGSIAAEHGLGTVKTPHLPLVRSPADLALMARMKDAFDPTGILNPGVVVPARPAQDG